MDGVAVLSLGPRCGPSRINPALDRISEAVTVICDMNLQIVSAVRFATSI